VEIKREVAQLPPLPAYVAPSNATRAQAAKNVQKRVVVVARAAPGIEHTDRLLCAVQSPTRLSKLPVGLANSASSFEV
jgi:hypothetical protein